MHLCQKEMFEQPFQKFLWGTDFMLVQINKYIKENIVSIGVFLAFVVTIVLRFQELTYQSHWIDEIIGVSYSNPTTSFKDLYSQAITDSHPPLYQILLWFWYDAFGYTEFAGRAFSAVAGSLGVVALFLTAKEFFNKEVALYATIIASMNYHLVYFAQETRSYSLVFLLTTLSYLFFFRVITQHKTKDLLWYFPFTIALLYTHYFGFFLVLTQSVVFLYMLFEQKEKRTRLLILGVLAGVGILISIYPLMAPILSHSGRGAFWISKPTPWFFISYLQSYVNSERLEVMFLILMAISVNFSIRNAKKNPYKTEIMVLWLWVIFGYLLPYIRSITSTPLLHPRYTIIVLPALILIVSHGIYLLKSISIKTEKMTLLMDSTIVKAIVVLTITLNCGHQFLQAKYYTKVTKQQWREILIEIASAKEKIPAYEFIDIYSRYNKVLKIDVDIRPRSLFEKKLKDGTLEKCTFIMDGHSDFIGKAGKLLSNKDLMMVHIMNKLGTSAVLYAYKTDPKVCSDLFPGLEINHVRNHNRNVGWY